MRLRAMGMLFLMLGCGGLGSGTVLSRAIHEAGLTPSPQLAVDMTLRCVPAQDGCAEAVQARAEGLLTASAIPLQVDAAGPGAVLLRVPALDGRLHDALVDTLIGQGGLCMRALADTETTAGFWQSALAAESRLSPVAMPPHLEIEAELLSSALRAQLRSLAAAEGRALGIAAAAGAGETARVYLLEGSCALDGGDVSSAEVAEDTMGIQPVLTVGFTEAGRSQLEALTAAHVDEAVVIQQGERVLMAPVVREPISGGQLQIDPGAAAGQDRVGQLLALHGLREQLLHPYPAGVTVEHTVVAATGE